MTHQLTKDQLHDLEVTERIASCFSLLGTSFILFTFVYSPAFRKPVNRLIFYASWGNTMMNIATLISQTGIRAGGDSHLCQFQGFLIQMFLPADALWNLAMAINVYLTLFRKRNAQQLKALEWRYHVMCYGTTFLIAFIYIFIETSARGKMYGPATLWCWIDIKWVAFRIALCYAPAWCCILISMFIYIIAGREIFAKRRQLRAFSNPTRPVPVKIENPFTSFKTTEVEVTRELAVIRTPSLSQVYLSPQDKSRTQQSSPQQDQHSGYLETDPPHTSPAKQGYDQYSVNIASQPISSPFNVAPQVRPSAVRMTTGQQRNNTAALEANTAAWGYTKVALLFFVSLLVTWVPSSINRVYSLVHPELVSLPFTYASGIVLPLMGFWNAVIYFTTSWSAVRSLFADLFGHASGMNVRRTAVLPSFGGAKPNPRSHRRRKGSGSDSVKVLKGMAGAGGYNEV
ncbi:hypothetical protein MMC21_000301 [Puttea exsequens]|nr:hypothetical protein [Puttea exsequens]